MTTISDGLYQHGGMPVTGGIPPFLRNGSKVFFVDPVNGLDGNLGTAGRPFASLYKAHKMCTSGNNDTVFLIGDGTSTNTARLSTANATTADSSLTTGELIWSKNATHLIGISSGSGNSRARIATPTGTYTASTFGSNTCMTVSGSGCYISNISLTSSFSTGNASEVTMVVSGSYNTFNNVTAGHLSPEALAGVGARSLKVTTGGENKFINCQFGFDTATRNTTANATLEFAGGTARDQFIGCVFPIRTSYSGSLHLLGTGNSCISSWILFKDCLFTNAMDGTSVNMTVMGSFTTASPSGSIILKGSAMFGATKWGDTNFLANSYVDGVGGAATAGIMLNPT